MTVLLYSILSLFSYCHINSLAAKATYASIGPRFATYFYGTGFIIMESLEFHFRHVSLVSKLYSAHSGESSP